MKEAARYWIYLIVVVLIGLELSLRGLGYQPGTFRKQSGFEEVDSLILYENFINDTRGIYRFSSWISDSIPTTIEHNLKYPDISPDQETPLSEIDYLRLRWHAAIENYELDEVYPVDDVHYIWQTAYCLTSEQKPIGCRLSKGENWNTPFPSLIDSLRNTTELLSAFDSLVLEYSEKPFNKEGFRSIAFSPIKSNRLKVLILGDSFAYGMSARPYFNSFSDYLLAMGYLVYNTGIPGTDPAQYAAIVDKYIDKLRPDVVIVNLYVGNDLMPFPRHPHPYRPHEHMTNAGFFTSSPLGTYLSPQEAYSYYLSLQKIPLESESRFSKACSKSAITSIIWGIGYNLKFYGHPVLDAYNKTHSDISDAERVRNTAPHINKIKARCDSSKTPVLYCVIPDRFNTSENQGRYYSTNPELLNKLFQETTYYEPRNIVDSDFYGVDDCHFSNKGHEKYAVFLDSLIRTIAPR